MCWNVKFRTKLLNASFTQKTVKKPMGRGSEAAVQIGCFIYQVLINSIDVWFTATSQEKYFFVIWNFIDQCRFIYSG